MSQLMQELRIPQMIRTQRHGYRVPGVSAFLLFLLRMAHAQNSVQLMQTFEGSPAYPGDGFLTVNSHGNSNFLHVLTDLSRWDDLIPKFSKYIHTRSVYYENALDFIDGKLAKTRRPVRDPTKMYNGLKKHHGLKEQSVAFPNGMFGHFFGPLSGRRHIEILLPIQVDLSHDQQPHCGHNCNHKASKSKDTHAIFKLTRPNGDADVVPSTIISIMIRIAILPVGLADVCFTGFQFSPGFMFCLGSCPRGVCILFQIFLGVCKNLIEMAVNSAKMASAWLETTQNSKRADGGVHFITGPNGQQIRSGRALHFRGVVVVRTLAFIIFHISAIGRLPLLL